MVKKMILRMLSLVCLFGIFLCSSFSVYAYDIPYKSYHIDCVTSELGQIVIAIPFNYARYISIDGNNIVNQYSSVITGYANSLTAGNNTEYSIRFPVFESPQYRTSSYNQYEDLTVTSILSTNLPNINDSDFTIFSQSTLTNMVMCLIGGSIIILILKKR